MPKRQLVVRAPVFACQRPQGIILRRPRWLVPPEPSPHEAPSPDSLLSGKERDNRGSRHKSVEALMLKAIQEVGIDLLNGPEERGTHRLSFP